jgi:hypothetical protein
VLIFGTVPFIFISFVSSVEQVLSCLFCQKNYFLLCGCNNVNNFMLLCVF